MGLRDLRQDPLLPQRIFFDEATPCTLPCAGNSLGRRAHMWIGFCVDRLQLFAISYPMAMQPDDREAPYLAASSVMSLDHAPPLPPLCASSRYIRHQERNLWASDYSTVRKNPSTVRKNPSTVRKNPSTVRKNPSTARYRQGKPCRNFRNRELQQSYGLMQTVQK